MSELRKEHSVSAVCRTLGVSRSGHYARLRRVPSERELEDGQLGDLIVRIHRESHCAYGCPRIQTALRKLGRRHGNARVERIMDRRGVVGCSRGGFRPATTDSAHSLGHAPNLLADAGMPDSPGQLWVSDTTFVPCGEGWAYLAVTMDLFSRRVVGWSVSETNDAELAASALRKAIERERARWIIHHSDRGSTYASARFRAALDGMEATQSMSRKGNCYDNAAMESFFGSLKAEWIRAMAYRDLEQARQSIFAYIEGFYNTRRIHTSIGMAPDQKHREASA